MRILQSADCLSRFPLCCVTTLRGLASLVSTAFAEPLSFNAALALAVREAPMLRAESAQVDAARQAAIPAGELPDPKLTLGLDNVPVEGVDRFSLSGEPMTMQRIGVMQEFPNNAKRGARVEVARGRILSACFLRGGVLSVRGSWSVFGWLCWRACWFNFSPGGFFNWARAASN